MLRTSSEISGQCVLEGSSPCGRMTRRAFREVTLELSQDVSGSKGEKKDAQGAPCGHVTLAWADAGVFKGQFQNMFPFLK